MPKVVSKFRQLLLAKAARENRRISLRKASEETRLPESLMGALDNDRWKTIHRDQLVVLCTYLDCTPGDLFRLQEEERGAATQ